MVARTRTVQYRETERDKQQHGDRRQLSNPKLDSSKRQAQIMHPRQVRA
jgi:hypothetical protein